tara:strand:- start:438 stop:725 length:288 start_codon:yes stop_codon:yes gene_type:complete
LNDEVEIGSMNYRSIESSGAHVVQKIGNGKRSLIIEQLDPEVAQRSYYADSGSRSRLRGKYESCNQGQTFHKAGWGREFTAIHVETLGRLIAVAY